MATRSSDAVRWGAAAALIFVVGTFAVPWLEARDVGAASWMDSVYGKLCHQRADRTFSFAGLRQAVCARCAGLYVGGWLGLAGWAALAARGGRPRGLWLALALAPSVVDGALPWLGLPGLSNVPRFLLAWPAGFVAGLLLAEGLDDLPWPGRRSTWSSGGAPP
jgi:uncharacterized membrane protein